MRYSTITVVALVVLTMACCATKKPVTNVSYMGPVAIIYKTKADYSKYVPVTLSDDKSRIVSYPAPQDVYRNGSLAYPIQLAKGFLLDNRGVNANTAFLKITYEDYSKLSALPSLDDLYKQIVDKDPVTEIYNLGYRGRFKDEVAEINELINHHDLKEFKKLK
jgi:hypothetical protein